MVINSHCLRDISFSGGRSRWRLPRPPALGALTNHVNLLSARLTHCIFFSLGHLTGHTSFNMFLTLINVLLQYMHHPSQNLSYQYPLILHKFSFHHVTFSHHFFYNVFPPLVFHKIMLLLCFRDCMNGQRTRCHSAYLHHLFECKVDLFRYKVDHQRLILPRKETNFTPSSFPLHLLVS